RYRGEILTVEGHLDGAGHLPGEGSKAELGTHRLFAKVHGVELGDRTDNQTRARVCAGVVGPAVDVLRRVHLAVEPTDTHVQRQRIGGWRRLGDLVNTHQPFVSVRLYPLPQ